MSNYVDNHIDYNIYNTSPWMSIRLDALSVASSKTLPGNKNPVGKNNPDRKRKRLQRAYVLLKMVLGASLDHCTLFFVAWRVDAFQCPVLTS